MNPEHGRPRWQGKPHRLEVWYLTATDAATGTGVWVHHEIVAPDEGDPYTHGWTAIFEPDREPVWERFGPVPAVPGGGGPWNEIDSCVVDDGVARGSAGSLGWDLTFDDDSPALYTFPKWAWERSILPGAQIVPAPSATISGSLTVDGRTIAMDGRGALARIDGHGSAKRWGWLHADLDCGDEGFGALEIVTATATRPVLNRLPPLAILQLRLPGEDDWPGQSLVGAFRMKTDLRGDGFTVKGRYRGRSLDVEVGLPEDRVVQVGYVDPDGATATCTNSERADATVTVDGRRWHLDATAHAEVGFRP